MTEPLKDPRILPHTQDGAHPPQAHALCDIYYQTYEKIVFSDNDTYTIRERSTVESVANKSFLA